MKNVEKNQARVAAEAVASSMGFKLRDLMETDKIGQTEYLSIREVARRLGISRDTVRRRISDGAIYTIKLGKQKNSTVKIPWASVEKWIEECSIAETGDR